LPVGASPCDRPATEEALPLSQDPLLRAIQLEYRELGKLSTEGRTE
jgi:hypothetical protein